MGMNSNRMPLTRAHRSNPGDIFSRHFGFTRLFEAVDGSECLYPDGCFTCPRQTVVLSSWFISTSWLIPLTLATKVTRTERNWNFLFLYEINFRIPRWSWMTIRHFHYAYSNENHSDPRKALPSGRAHIWDEFISFNNFTVTSVRLGVISRIK